MTASSVEYTADVSLTDKETVMVLAVMVSAVMVLAVMVLAAFRSLQDY